MIDGFNVLLWIGEPTSFVLRDFAIGNQADLTLFLFCQG